MNICRIVLLLLVVQLSGCGQKMLVALVPDQDGKIGNVVVENSAGTVSLDAPYQATTIGEATTQPATPVTLSKETLDATFKEALSIQPQPPIHFLLYFEKDTTLTEESLRLLPDIIAAIQVRKSIDISVVGHTDSTGSKEFNTTLSKERAGAVRNLLAAQGAEPNTMRISSHGKENPLFPTGDNVNEPRNRRVEVVVR
jgi:outer membrane protein OmpA-like peptidoglycan-associated protein